MLSSREKISTRQAIILFILFMFSSLLWLYPFTAAKFGKQAGWLTPVFAIFPYIGLVFVLQALFKNNREANLSDIIFKTFGRVLGTVLLILYLIWMLLTLGIYVRFFAEKFLSSLLPNTHMNFFTVTLLATVFYASQRGVVYIARTAEFLFLVFSAIFFIIFIITIPNFEVINLFPVTHHDILPLMKSTYSSIGIWGSLTFVFFFGDKINDKEHIKRFGLQGAVYLVLAALMISIQTIGVYGYSVIERLSLPYVFVVKGVSILKTIERIESVTVASWIILDFIAISVTLLILTSIIKSIFALTDERSLLSPVTIFAFIFSQYIARNRFELENFFSLISIPANIIFGFVFPLIILVVGKIRGKI
ncbi:MAG TPA: endospore germination permease [Clostridiaceae bacterium]|nr:endospore germination permease [Clostridiaceae bacterium]